jgi:hypothetical protein
MKLFTGIAVPTAVVVLMPVVAGFLLLTVLSGPVWVAVTLWKGRKR